MDKENVTGGIYSKRFQSKHRLVAGSPTFTMTKLSQLLFYVLVFVSVECKIKDDTQHEPRKFPDGFIFGTATASYQVEGAWNVDGKTENIWDHLSHQKPCAIAECHTGDVADNSYYLYKRDVEMLRELGVDFYRFSLSWPRILPNSFPDKINMKGVQYYNNLINELLKYNIQPMVTLYHWDLPQKLQDLGGWTNPLIVDWFTDYSRIAFELFGDRVKHWFTINEPKEICYLGYGSALMAPMHNNSGIGDYLCSKNILVAHAKAYHLYNDKYRSIQRGNISIVMSGLWFEAVSEQDEEAAEDANQFEWGVYAHPIFSKEGDFPQIMKEKIAAKSLTQGFTMSRLPQFTPAEIKLLKGSSDFFGLNHYSTSMVYRNETVYGYHPTPSLYDDIEIIFYTNNSWEGTYTKMVPWGFYKLLTKIRKDYDNPPIIISENGFGTEAGFLDEDRIKYYRKYLNAMLDAIDEGSDIRGYTAWSLMDNFEWTRGYTMRFGLYEVDYESPERTRTPRKSAYVYKQIVRTRALDPHYEPDMSVPLSIEEGHISVTKL